MRDTTHDRQDEAGVALVMVLGIGFVLTLLITAALQGALGSLPQASQNEQAQGAQGAADAGLEDFIWRMNRNAAYYDDFDATNTGGNDALDGWAEIGPDSEGKFFYRFDASSVNETGSIDLVVTGRVRDELRTIATAIRPSGFLDYIYFTNFETADYSDPMFAASALTPAACSDVWEVRNAGCVQIQFAPGDVITGPLRSNDQIRVEGATFNGPVQIAYPGPDMDGGVPRLTRGAGGTYLDGPPTPAAPFNMPPSNSEIRAQTDPATATGCNYYGPTYLHLEGDRMRVWSPHSDTPPAAEPGPDPLQCGPWDGSALVPFPDNGVIYISDSLGACTGQHPLGLEPGLTGDITNYGCEDGDAFVWGENGEQMTIASENNIYVIHDLVYEDGLDSSNLTGLVANNFINLYHPVSCTGVGDGWCNLPSYGGTRPPFNNNGLIDQPNGETTPTVWRDPQIDAAMISIGNSFKVDNWRYGDQLGILTVNGAIAQRFRGIVGFVGTTGPLKNYVYDERLQFLSPPFFIEPTEAVWRFTRYAAIPNPPTCGAGDTVGTDDCIPPL